MSNEQPLPTPQELLARATRELRAMNEIRSKSQSGGGRSRFPYYCDTAAAEVADIIDSVSAASPPQPFLWHSNSCTSSTLRCKWQQGLRYLIEHMDEDGEYKRLSDQLRIIMVAGVGLRICPIASNLNTRVLTPVDDNWKRDFQEFLARSEANSVFERIVILPPEEHEWLWNLVNGEAAEFLSHNIVPPGQRQTQNIRIQILNI